MELFKIVALAFVMNAFAVYWTAKILARMGATPPFTIRSLIQNKGYTYWNKTDF